MSVEAKIEYLANHIESLPSGLQFHQLVGRVQELERNAEAQAKRIEDLEAQVDELEEQLNTLEMIVAEEDE